MKDFLELQDSFFLIFFIISLIMIYLVVGDGQDSNEDNDQEDVS